MWDTQEDARPSLLEWDARRGHPETRAGRVTGLDRRAGRRPSAGLRTSIRSSRARSWRSSPTTSGCGPRGSCRRASAGGSPGAGRRCGRSWAGCSASRPPRCGSGPRPWASPSSIEGRASSSRSASTSRIRPTWGSIAVCRGREIGVDLEQLRPITEAERIVASFFTAAEQAAFAAIAEPDRAAAFLRGWTRKEAVLKGFGMGISGLSAKHETGFGTSALDVAFHAGGPLVRGSIAGCSGKPRRGRTSSPRWPSTWGIRRCSAPSSAGPSADGSLPARPPNP